MNKFLVYLSREYAPEALRKKLKFGEPLAICTLLANSQKEAATKAWEQYGEDWLDLIKISEQNHIKHISLYVRPINPWLDDLLKPPVLVWSRTDA